MGNNASHEVDGSAWLPTGPVSACWSTLTNLTGRHRTDAFAVGSLFCLLVCDFPWFCVSCLLCWAGTGLELANTFSDTFA